MLIIRQKKKQTEVNLIEIKVRKGNIEKALRQLKKQVKETKLFLELKDREFYTKPSVIKREKRAKSLLRRRKLSEN